MAVRVLVNGATGRMGQLVVKNILKDKELKLVGQTTHDHQLADEIKKTNSQVVVDFTRPEVVFNNVNTVLDAGAYPVIGTTGLSLQQIDTLKAKAKQLKRGGIIAPNFSLGAVLMMKYAQEIAKHFPHVEIIEMHHDGKLDSPSGTAVLTAELIANARHSIPDLPAVHETVKGARGATHQAIPIHAVRLPGLVAHQQIIFGGVGETLTLKLDSIDRQCFMPGVLLACKKVMALESLVVGLEHLL